MATAAVLKVAHTTDERVRGIADKMVGVDDRVASVDTKVETVDIRVVGVDERVAGVDERVKTVDDKVAMAIEGVQTIFTWCYHLFPVNQMERRLGSS
jgi:hypothetical protein